MTKDEQAVELIHCAYVNLFTNVLDKTEAAKRSPVIQLAKLQLVEGLALLGRHVLTTDDLPRIADGLTREVEA